MGAVIYIYPAMMYLAALQKYHPVTNCSHTDAPADVPCRPPPVPCP